jgi:hypothetical protein
MGTCTTKDNKIKLRRNRQQLADKKYDHMKHCIDDVFNKYD